MIFLAWILAGGLLSAGTTGLEVRREVVIYPPGDAEDQFDIVFYSVSAATLFGVIGGVIGARGEGLVPFLCFSLFTVAVVFVVYRVAHFCRWINRSIDESARRDLGS